MCVAPLSAAGAGGGVCGASPRIICMNSSADCGRRLRFSVMARSMAIATEGETVGGSGSNCVPALRLSESTGVLPVSIR